MLKARLSVSEERVGEVLSVWLRDQLGCEDLRVGDIRVPLDAGESNETFLFGASWTDAQRQTHTGSYILRMEPTSYNLFRHSFYDEQIEVMQLVGRHGVVPVPTVEWICEDSSLLGARFYVMNRCAGKPPLMQPPYTESGWLKDASPNEQAAIWRAAVQAVANIQATPIDDFSLCHRLPEGQSGVEQQLQYWADSLHWAAEGAPQPVLEQTLQWLQDSMPTRPRVALSWGDARLANLLYESAKLEAVLDWEMVSLGGPLMDLGYLMYYDLQMMDAGRLPGFSSREDTIVMWESLTGASADGVEWYEVFAGFRLASILVRRARLLQALEPTVAAHRFTDVDNKHTRKLAAILELEPPQQIVERLAKTV